MYSASAPKKYFSPEFQRAFRPIRVPGQRRVHNFRLKIVYGPNALFKNWERGAGLFQERLESARSAGMYGNNTGEQRFCLSRFGARNRSTVTNGPGQRLDQSLRNARYAHV